MAGTGEQLIRLRLAVRGRVQGVGFRYATLDEAQALNLTGWVGNRPDGSVEVVAEGPRGRVQRLAVWCHDGPRGALVSDVVAEWGEATGEFRDFKIRY